MTTTADPNLIVSIVPAKPPEKVYKPSDPEFNPTRWAKGLRVSPSQVKNHDRCPRYWWYVSVEKRPTPQSVGGIEGSHAHTQQEYRFAGLPYERLPHVEALEQWVPAPQAPGWYSELEIFVENFVDKVSISGRIDLINETGTYVDMFGITRESRDVPEILDFKFGNKNYWLTASELRADLQLNAYAIAKYPDRDFVRLSHLNAERPPPGAPKAWRGDRQKTTVLRTKGELRDYKERVLAPEIRRLRDTWLQESAEQTKVNKAGCRAFGGCPFMKDGTCTQRDSSEEIQEDLLASILAARTKTQTQPAQAGATTSTQQGDTDVGTLFDDIMAQKAATRGAAPPPPAHPSASSAATMAALMGGGAPAPTVAAPAAPAKAPTHTPPPPAQPSASSAATMAALMGGGAPAPALAIVPPQAPTATAAPLNGTATHTPLPEPEPEEPEVETPAMKAMREQMAKDKAEAEAEEAREEARRSAAAIRAEVTPVVDIMAQKAASSGSELGPGPGRRWDGRRWVEDEPAVVASPVADAPVAAELPAPTPATDAPAAEKPKRAYTKRKAESTDAGVSVDPAPTATAVPSPATPVGIWLFVDCAPGSGARTLDAYLGGICDRIAEDNGLPDLLCKVPNDHIRAFNGWKGALAARIRATPPAPGFWVIKGVQGDDKKAVLVNTLAAMAEFTVWG